MKAISIIPIMSLIILSITVASAIPLNVQVEGGEQPFRIIILDSKMNEVYNSTENGNISVDLPEQDTYHVVVFYRNVPYQKVVELNRSTNVSFHLYEPVSRMDILLSPFNHILIRQSGDSSEVIEIFSVQTPDNMSFKGKVYLNIPDNSFSPRSPDIPIWKDQNGYYFDLAIPAGEVRQYAITYKLGNGNFEKKISLNTSFLSILVENPDILRSYNNLEVEGPVEFDGKNYFSLFSRNITAGSVIGVTLSPASVPQVDLNEDKTQKGYFWMGVGIIGAIGIILGYQGYRMRRPDIEELEARKGALLSVLERLEKDLESGEISPEEYARLKARYKREAMKILEKLDRIKSKMEDNYEEEE